MKKESIFANCAYVIDKEYHILHYNTLMKEIYPDLETGDICYEKLQGETQPCRVCPLTTLKKEGLLYYNKLKKAWIDCMAAPLDLFEDTGDHVVICHVITEMREDQKEEALRLLEEESRERDTLTGLYNRENFFQRADAMLKASRSSEYCILALDIENFKLYNELYGFSQGNEFLHYIGETLKSILNNIGFAGHLGEDDFVVFMPNRKEILTEIKAKLERYIDDREQNQGFYPAMGIYVIDDVSASLLKMYDKAATARTMLRGNQTSRVIWYDDTMMRDMEAHYALLNDIKLGLQRDEFLLYLQPKCDMNNDRIIGMEALCRWQHPQNGILGPARFIKSMERNGLITELDCQIWEKVCKTLRQWMEKGQKIVPISVNVSRLDFFELNVAEAFERLVQKYEIPKHYLEIEVTESAYAENESIVKKAVEQLRRCGFTVLMDDFGSAYSSLNMLQNVSVDILKFDMRFLQLGEDTEERGIHILETMIQLARTLHFTIIAEGVETERQKNLLLQMGCRYAQGYFYYHPMPVEDAGRLLAEPDGGER